MTEQEKIIITKYDLLYEQRMTRVETTMAHIDQTLCELKTDMKSDFRWLFGLILLLAGLMAKGFHWY